MVEENPEVHSGESQCREAGEDVMELERRTGSGDILGIHGRTEGCYLEGPIRDREAK